MAVLGYLSKLNRGFGLAFGAHFRYVFFPCNAPYLIVYPLTKFPCHIFFTSQDIKQNVLLSSYLDN